MPITFSHPAAAVPFAKLGLPLSALVVGSMAPDFPYFLHASTYDHYGHTPAGLFSFCIPAGLVALGLFHAVLKLPLLSLLPMSHQERLMPVTRRFKVSSVGQWCRIVVALVLGAMTHVVWDSFTQYNGWAAQRFPILSAQIVPSPFGTVGVIEALHLVNSLIGIGLLCYWYASWLQRTPRESSPLPLQLSPRFRYVLMIIMVLLAWGGAGTYSYFHQPNIFNLIRHTVVSGVQLLVAELLVFSLGWHWKASRSKT